MKYFIILLIASFVFFGCDANNAGDDSDIGSGDGSPQDDGSGSNEDEDPQDDNGGSNADDNGGSNADDDPQVADLCLGVNTSSITHTLDDGKDYTIIRDQVGLQNIENSLTAHHILCNNISLNGPFTRIRGEFTGTLEGNYKTISNLEIQAQGDYFVGLFDAIAASGEVRNLKISLADKGTTTPSILGTAQVGALVGRNKGTITNVGVTDGYVKGNSSIGGLVGQNEGGTITKSYAISKVEGTTDATGGLVGTNTGTIENSYATGDVEGNNYIGGLVGWNDNNTITNSYATGTVTGTGSDIGGLVGYNSSTGTIIASYFDAETTGQSRGPSPATAYHTDTNNNQVYTLADGNGDEIDQSNFPTWDDTIWTWQEDGQWPILQSQ